MNYPLLVCLGSLALLALSIGVGNAFRKRWGVPKEDERVEVRRMSESAPADPAKHGRSGKWAIIRVRDFRGEPATDHEDREPRGG